MKLTLKKFTVLCFLWIYLLSVLPIPTIAAQAMPELKSKSAMVVDSVNGQILHAENVDTLMEVGGVSKVLLLYLVVDAINQGTITTQDPVAISDKAYELSQDYGIQNVPLRQDFQYSVEELMEAVVVTGANGATLALAEHVAGDEKKALKMMAQTLEKWGIHQYKFVNVTGLPQGLVPHQTDTYEKGAVNKMTAQACAIATYQLIQKYPKILNDAKQPTATLKKDSDDPYEMTNTIAMIEDNDYAYKGTTGLMLGTSKKDGDSAIITAERNHLPVISIILGTQKRGEGQRYHESKKILDYIFAMYVMQDVVKKEQKVTEIGQIKVKDGVKDTVEINYQTPYQMAMPVVGKRPRLTYEFIPNEKIVHQQNTLHAPVKKGQTIGQVQVTIDKKHVAYLPTAKGNRVDIQTAEVIAEAPWYQKGWNNFTQTIHNSWEATRVFFTNLFN